MSGSSSYEYSFIMQYSAKCKRWIWFGIITTHNLKSLSSCYRASLNSSTWLLTDLSFKPSEREDPNAPGPSEHMHCVTPHAIWLESTQPSKPSHHWFLNGKFKLRPKSRGVLKLRPFLGGIMKSIQNFQRNFISTTLTYTLPYFKVICTYCTLKLLILGFYLPL